MTRHMHVHFICLLLALLASATGRAKAQVRRIDDPPVPRLAKADEPPARLVTYLDNEVTKMERDYIVIRSAVELDAPPGRWYALDVEFRLSRAQPLILPSGKLLVKRWNNLFTPHGPRPARWLDCRLDVDFSDLQAAENFPKGKTFVLWAMGLIYNWEERSYVGSGWDVRAPLLLTTDSNGTVISCKAPRLLPMDLLRLNPAWKQTLRTRKLRLDVEHLKPLPETRAVMVARTAGPGVPVLAADDVQAWQPQGYGAFFGPIDTPEKARELLELQMPGHLVIQTRQQYQAILDTLKALGWARDRDLLAEPPTIGETITEIEGLGYRISQLSIDPLSTPDGPAWGDVVYRDIYVTEDGRVGFDPVLCVQAPQRPPENATDWQQPAPSDTETYTRAIDGVLGEDGYRILPERLVMTDDVVELALPIEAPADIVDAAPSTPGPAADTEADTPPAPAPVTAPVTAPAPQDVDEAQAPPLPTPQPLSTAADATATQPAEEPESTTQPAAPAAVETSPETLPAESNLPDTRPAEPENTSTRSARPKASALPQRIGKNIADIRRDIVLVLPPAALNEDASIRQTYSGEALCETDDDGRYVLDFRKGVLRSVRKQVDDNGE